MIPWPLYLAFKQIFPTGRKFTLQTLFYAFSILGVALGVFLLVASQSAMQHVAPMPVQTSPEAPVPSGEGGAGQGPVHDASLQGNRAPGQTRAASDAA